MIYTFNAIPIEILMAVFIEIKRILKIPMEPQKTPNNQSYLEKKRS